MEKDKLSSESIDPSPADKKTDRISSFFSEPPRCISYIVPPLALLAMYGFYELLDFFSRRIAHSIKQDSVVSEKFDVADSRGEVCVPLSPENDCGLNNGIVLGGVGTEFEVQKFFDEKDGREKLRITAIKGDLKINEQMTALEGCTVVVDKDNTNDTEK